jgi:hypothetical protein
MSTTSIRRVGSLDSGFEVISVPLSLPRRTQGRHVDAENVPG